MIHVVCLLALIAGAGETAPAARGAAGPLAGNVRVRHDTMSGE